MSKNRGAVRLMQGTMFDAALPVEIGRELDRCRLCANWGEITRQRQVYGQGTWVTAIHREDGCKLGIESGVAGTGCTCLGFRDGGS